MSNIRIVSDGTVSGTSIIDADGKEMRGVSKIEYVPDANNRNDMGIARLTFCNVHLDVVAKVGE